MAKMGPEWSIGKVSTDTKMMKPEVEARSETGNTWELAHYTQEQPVPLLEPVYELKLTDLFDEPLEVLEGVSVVLKAERSPMTIRAYQFVQYGSGHRIWVYVDLVWGAGVQPWLIASSAAAGQINGGITTILQRAGYTNSTLGSSGLRRHEAEQNKEHNWNGYLRRFFDLSSIYNCLFVDQGRWDLDIGMEDGLPYLELHFDNTRPTRLECHDGYLLRRSQWPFIEHLIGKKLCSIHGDLVSEEVIKTYYEGVWMEWGAEVGMPTPIETPYTGTLTDDRLRVYANLPGFVTMDTELAPIEPNPDEWVLLKCGEMRFGEKSTELSPTQLRKYFEDPIETYHTHTGKMNYVWTKPANSFEWELIESKKSDEADYIAKPQPKYSGWFADLLRWFGLRRV